MRTVLITGCSEGGIGEELAKQFHAQGLHVIATARNVSSMTSLSQLGMETLALDVTKPESILVIKKHVEDRTGGKLDILVNNAGVAYPYAAADLDMNKVRDLFEVNLFGVMAMTKEFIPSLIATRGCVVNIGSIAAVMPVPFSGTYNASKAALHAYSDTLRVELAPFNVRVVTIAAGNVQSNITKLWHKLPEGSIYEPIRAEYQDRRINHFQDAASPRGPVIARIVNEALKPNPTAWLWVGKNSLKAWIMSTFLWRTAFDKLLSGMFSLTKLTERLKDKSV